MKPTASAHLRLVPIPMIPTLPHPLPTELRRIRWHTSIADIMRWRYEATGQRCRTFLEAGVGPLDVAAAPSVYQAMQEGWGPERMLLVEPNEDLCAAAVDAMPNARHHLAAISDHAGIVRLIPNGGSSYVEGTWSPTPIAAPPYEVQALTMDDLDSGDIDVLILDCEGAEWAALSRMTSRPWLLSVEIWPNHPHASEIEAWLELSGYRVFATTGPQGETWICVR